MRALLVAALAAQLAVVTGCGPADRGAGGADACSGRGCDVVDCADRGLPPTTISGTVYAPSGTLPLFGVNVYVPLGEPGPLADGVQCSRCQDALPGGSVVRTESGTTGAFSLADAPAGRDVPLVVQVGKWRRSIVVPEVRACEDNPLPAELTRLPRMAAEGDLPRIAIATGAWDALECLVLKLGVDVSEFTTDAGGGRVHLFDAGGANQVAGAVAAPAPAALWASLDTLAQYDVTLFSCQGAAFPAEKTQAMMDNVKQYADRGGRVFLSHYHAIWIDGEVGNPAHAPGVWPGLATCDRLDTFDGRGVIDQVDNPKGASFAAWMTAVGGSPSPGEFEITEGRQTCSSIDLTRTERWVYQLTPDGQLPQQFQFSTPVEVNGPERCGKVVFSDMHVSSTSDSTPSVPFPGGCAGGDLTPQEKALAFMLFDLSSCVGPLL